MTPMCLEPKPIIDKQKIFEFYYNHKYDEKNPLLLFFFLLKQKMISIKSFYILKNIFFFINKICQ